MIPITNIPALLDGYEAEQFALTDVIDEVFKRIAENGDDNVWITLLSKNQLTDQIEALPKTLTKSVRESLPLYGVPFAIKDNIDVEGLPTTAGCAAFAYTPSETAPVVRRILDAGGILVGKANMTQFAIGLAGERSPYGIPRNRFNPEYITGGSSSGSAVAVADKLVSFTLGTDTAGSVRLPAALANVVGLKPTRGLLSVRGVVPACLSLDCVGILAEDAISTAQVFDVVRAADPLDAWSREAPQQDKSETRTVGILAEPDREFFGDDEFARVYRDGIDRLAKLGFDCVEFDYAPFREAATMMYSGPWMAEREVAIGDFLRENPDDVVPISRDAILNSSRFTAADTFRAFHKLADLKLQSQETWDKCQAILLPTSGTTFKIADVHRDPFGVLDRLSHYTNFVNLLDLCGITLPTGFTSDGLPVGLTLIAPAFEDDRLLQIAEQYEQSAAI